MGATGLRYTRYERKAPTDNINSFRIAVKAGTIAAKVLEDGFRTEPETVEGLGRDYC